MHPPDDLAVGAHVALLAPEAVGLAREQPREGDAVAVEVRFDRAAQASPSGTVAMMMTALTKLSKEPEAARQPSAERAVA